MNTYFKRISVSLLSCVMLSTASYGFAEASEKEVNNHGKKDNSGNLVFEDRFPTLDELKNAEGNVVVLSNKSMANEGNITFKSSGAITNAKRYKKSYSLDSIMAGGGSATTLVGFIRQSLGKSVKLGPLAAVTMTAGGMRAAGYKTLVVHVYSYELGIDPDTGAPLKKKKKVSQIEKYELKK
ncbi:hypothetical protein AB1K28_14150 [Staphylococcus aureus]|uniref:hypothetical protein n=1 Tax=Staphylococcus aureus TaxID=1280 RepID=UPI002482CB81|nr:hypothetical protein [Staphylococcus aureus]MDI1598425.1 hypothetical protein [Staphylococcus aureus]MDI1681614.1 hypothetical protein [Staphylococcus aureus]MDI1748780.1 hypothetical protein [Staphylococcus aureus]MDI1772763.1 hypothetical protein [Staphylococcus aureus]MDI1792564.1 hypothetical protein [Staphylococcus aureus]